MMDELLAARGITVSYETVRQWALKFAQSFANQIRRWLPVAGYKWHMDEVVIMISGVKHWLWRAFDQTGTVLDILVQSRRDTQAAKRLVRDLWLSAEVVRYRCERWVLPSGETAMANLPAGIIGGFGPELRR